MNETGSNELTRHPVAPASILIVEEQANIREFMSTALRREGHRVEEAVSGRQALHTLTEGRFDLLIVDLSLSDTDGAELVQSAKRLVPEAEIVVLTSENTVGEGLAMVGDGAYDLLVKPFPSVQLSLVARRALERKALVKKVRVLEETIRGRVPFDRIVGTSRALTDVLKIVDQIARLETGVLISGERGTGKELIARALHALSPRAEKPFAVINCGAIPESLRDREIFGQMGKMPDGAHHTEQGLFAPAHGGTVFLSDVAELTPPAQQNMLRLLQNGKREPPGASGGDPDVRVVAATSHDLEKCVEEKVFDEDLYYRLNVISIQVPPLRERTEDIPLLARHFLRRALRTQGAAQMVISPRAMSVLAAQPWEGNVRELKDVIERALVVDRDGVLGLDDLPFAVSENAADKVIDLGKAGSLTLNELEREYILEVLAECGGSRKNTAAKLGITTATLWRKLKRFEKGD